MSPVFFQFSSTCAGILKLFSTSIRPSLTMRFEPRLFSSSGRSAASTNRRRRMKARFRTRWMRLPASRPVFCVHWKRMLSQRAGKLRQRSRKLAARPDLAREQSIAARHCSIAAAAIAINTLISSATSPPPLVRCMRIMPTRSFDGSTHSYVR